MADSLVLSVPQVGELERFLSKEGISPRFLMEQAGKTIAQEVFDRSFSCPLVILVGNGNNGGDGWVSALHLARAGYDITLVSSKPAEELTVEPARSSALYVTKAAQDENLLLDIIVSKDPSAADEALEHAEAVVDALCGVGFSGETMREPFSSWISAANRRKKQALENGESLYLALSADVPSGLSAQTGQVADVVFEADATVTMLVLKPAFADGSCEKWTGEVVLAELTDCSSALDELGFSD